MLLQETTGSGDLRMALPKGWSGAGGCEHALPAGGCATAPWPVAHPEGPTPTRAAPLPEQPLGCKSGNGLAWAQGRCKQAPVLGGCVLRYVPGQESSWVMSHTPPPALLY